MKKLIILFLTLLAVTTYGQNTDTQNTTQFNVIRNETATGGNTKARIADAYEALNHSKVSRMEALVTTGTNDYLIAADAAIVSYSNGGKTLQLLVRFVNANTGAVRVNINSIALVALVKGNGSAFVGGEISPGQMLWIAYTGSVFQVVDIGITNTSGTNEIPKSNITSFVPSGLFSSTLGNLDLGTGISGTDRTIAATGSATDVGIKINPKGAAGVHLQNDLFQFGSAAGSATLLVNGTGDFTVFGPDGPSSNGRGIYLKAGDGGTGGGNFNGGSTFLSGGLGSGTGVTGNVGFGTSVGSFGGGSKVVFVANAAVNPSTNPTGGFILYGDAGNASHPTIKLPSGTTIDLSLGGITNTAANNEITKSNATNIIPSGLYSSTLGDLTFGTGLSGTTRTITADGSAADVSLSYVAKGQGGHSFSSGSSGGIGFSYGSSYSISLVGAATSIFRTSKLSGAGSFFISASNGVSGGTAGDDLTLNGGSGYSSGVTNGGNVYISPGSKNSTGLNGNIGLFASSSGTFGAGEKVLFWADATTNPTTNPTSGGIMFVKSSDHSPYWRTPAGVETSMLGGSGGTVSTVSVVSANGLAGTVANPTTTPAITLSTTINGLVKGNGTAFSAASAGADYTTIGSQAQVSAGTDNTTAVSPLTLLTKLALNRTVTSAASIVQSDNQALIYFNSGSNFNFTIDALLTDTYVSFLNIGLGIVTFVNGTATYSGSTSLISGATGAIFYRASTTPLIVGSGSGSWDLLNGGTLLGVNTITSNAKNQLNFNGTWTATLAADAMATFGGTITGASGLGVRGYVFSPTMTAVGTSPQLVAVDIVPTFSGGTTPNFIGLRVLDGGITVNNPTGGGALILARQDQNAISSTIIMNATSGANAGAALFLTNSSTVTTSMIMLAYPPAATAGGIRQPNTGVIRTDLANGIGIGTTISAPIVSYTNNIERMRIDGTGNISSNSTSSVIYRNTNAGGDVSGHFVIDPAGSLSSGIAYTFDATNGFGMTQANTAGRRIQGAAIKPSGLTSTAGSEVMGLDFFTQSGGTAATSKMTLNGAGKLGIGGSPISTLDVFGSLGLKSNAISTDITLDATYYEVSVDASGGNRVETLPAAASSIGRVYVIKKSDSSVNSVTIDGNASETIDGATTKVVNTQYSGWQIKVNAAGTAWDITATF